VFAETGVLSLGLPECDRCTMAFVVSGVGSMFPFASLDSTRFFLDHC
jgi:hypothetical protein